jgi:MtfA peptidase
MWFRKHHRERILAEPFPENWNAFLESNVAHFRLLSPEQQAALKGIVQVVVAEKSWEGCQGLQVSDEMKVTVAAQAGVMLLGMDHDYFSRVRTILLYPSGFNIPEDPFHQDGQGGIDASGQAVYRGPVILAWDEALAEGRDPSCGSNVVMHEFAHQLDFLDGYVDGMPEIPDRRLAERWEQVVAIEYQNLLHELRMDHDTLLGEYAGSNIGEFFAVACERFFTVPTLLKRAHPELYDLFAGFYRLDPTTWFAKHQPNFGGPRRRRRDRH